MVSSSSATFGLGIKIQALRIANTLTKIIVSAFKTGQNGYCESEITTPSLSK